MVWFDDEHGHDLRAREHGINPNAMTIPGFKIPAGLTPLARRTLLMQIVLNAATGPYMAMMQYALVVSVKTFHTGDWSVAWIYSLSNAYHLLAILMSDRVQRSDKIAWITWPNVAAFALLIALWRVGPGGGWLFITIIVVSQLIRTPIYLAQSILYRTNIPPGVRSWAMSINLAVYMLSWAYFSWAMGPLLDRSDLYWLGPIMVLTALIGIAGTVYFNRLRLIKEDGGIRALQMPLRRLTLADQWTLLCRDRGFREFLTSYMFFGAGTIAMTVAFPKYLEIEFHTTHEAAMNAFNVIPMITSVLMLPLWGALLDRKNPLVIRSWLMAAWGLTPLIYYFTHTLGGVYWAGFVLGLVQGGGYLIWYLGINYYARAHNVALYMGLHQLMTGIRSVLMPLLTIPICLWLGYRASMLVWAAMMCFGSVLLWAEVRREKRLGLLRSFAQHEAAEREAVLAGEDRAE